MPPAESGHYGHITRPRSSLSCVICRRRKVRCGREQPACSNCVRVQETCEYEGDIQRPTPQSKRKLSRGPSRAEVVTERPSPRIAEDTWSEWVGQEDSPILFNEAGYLSGPVTASDDFSTASSSFNQRHVGSIQSSNPTSSQTSSSRSSNPFLQQARPQILGSKPTGVPTWDTSSPEDPGRVNQIPTPSTVTTTTREREQDSDVSRKRPRTSNGPPPLQELTHSQEMVQSTLVNKESRTGTSPDEEYLERREFNARNPGYLSVRSGSRVRHVGNAFWGLVIGHVSLCINMHRYIMFRHY